MNIFGLIAIILMCATSIIISLLIIKKDVTIANMNKAATKVDEATPAIQEAVQIKDEDQVAQRSMDSVIAAVNDLMGIPKEGVDDKE